MLDANLNRTTFEYDGHDRLVKTRFPVPAIGSNSSSTTDYEQLTLDPEGNVTNRRLRDAQTIGYTYDALGRLTAKDLPGTEPDAAYAYDLLGRMTSAVQNSITNAMTWDALGRMTSETMPQGTVASLYDLAGRRTRVDLPGATSLFANYDYDLLGNVTKVRENGAVSGVQVLATYAYDNFGRRSSVTFGNGVVQAFTYDNAARLATQTNDLASTANDLTQTFAYNPASQINSVTRSNDLYAWTGHFNEIVPSTANGLNQITNVGAKTVTHDSKGNITAVGTDSYGYSSENFLTSGPGSTTLGYDPMGRLYQVASGATTTRMGYDGLDRIAEYDGLDGVQRRYIHGPGVDEPITLYEGSGTGTRRFLSSDERGSIISVTDGSGGLQGINKYDEYGVPQSTNLGKFGYTGQAWVPEVGLWYYKARFYLPDIGRFMQTDPIGYLGGINLYAYVLNDPVNLIDPLGLCPPGQFWFLPPRTHNPGHIDGGGGVTISQPAGYCKPILDRGSTDPGSGPPPPIGGLPGKVGPTPPPPKKKKLSQCIQNFMKESFLGYDWSEVTLSSASPLPGMAATNWGTTINVGSRFETIESNKLLLFHELAHSPQWASGELTRSGYIGSSVSGFMRGLASGWYGGGPSVRQIHNSIPVEQSADAIRDVLWEAYKEAGKPCG